MTNRGAVSATISPGGSYTIPAGYHNGSGKVSANSCTFKSDRIGIGGSTSNTIDLGASCKAGYVDITSSISGYNNASYKEEIVKVSNDNSNWVTKISHASNPRDSGGNTAYSARIDGYRYIRYEINYANMNLNVSSLSYAVMI